MCLNMGENIFILLYTVVYVTFVSSFLSYNQFFIKMTVLFFAFCMLTN